MWIVRLALRRPYTFVVVSFLIAILGVAAIITMPVDIFPYIDIPVVSVGRRPDFPARIPRWRGQGGAVRTAF